MFLPESSTSLTYSYCGQQQSKNLSSVLASRSSRTGTPCHDPHVIRLATKEKGDQKSPQLAALVQHVGTLFSPSRHSGLMLVVSCVPRLRLLLAGCTDRACGCTKFIHADEHTCMEACTVCTGYAVHPSKQSTSNAGTLCATPGKW